MKLAANYLAPAIAPPKSATGERRRIGKASFSNAFNESGDAFEQCRDRLSSARPQRNACQNGTLEYAPLWNGPPVRPVFAAQILGQVLINRNAADGGTAARSYRRGISRIPRALLLDVKI